ncbi:HalOD1 output domain-containing protein [Saliphagus sp. GCM10025334]
MNERTAGAVRSRGTGARHHVRYERDDDEPLSVATASAIAMYRGEEVLSSSTQLYEYVDPEALDALFADRHDGTPREAGRITIDLPDGLVVITSTSVHVTPDDERQEITS